MDVYVLTLPFSFISFAAIVSFMTYHSRFESTLAQAAENLDDNEEASGFAQKLKT